MSLLKLIVTCAYIAAIPIGLKAEVLTLGSVNDNVRKHVARYTPLAEYLEVALASQGITEVKVLVLQTSAEMAQALSDGRVDLYFDSPLVAAKVARDSGATPFLRRWKSGLASYHSVVVVPMDSNIQKLEDLAGHMIGFQEPDSTSGFLLPAGMLRNKGLEITELPSHEAEVPTGRIGYVFTGDDDNTLLWLVKKWIHAGAIDPGGWERLEGARPGQFRELARSIEVPRQVVIRRSDLDPSMVEALRATLIGMFDTEEGKAVMQKFHKTTRIDEFPDGVTETFEPIYRVLDDLNAMGIN